MYACINFNIRQHACLVHLRNTLLPVRFETIRHLEIHIISLVGDEYDVFSMRYPPDDRLTWAATCSALANMPGPRTLGVFLTLLTHLRRMIVQREDYLNPGDVAHILRPLERVRTVPHYAVHMFCKITAALLTRLGQVHYQLLEMEETKGCLGQIDGGVGPTSSMQELLLLQQDAK